MNSRFNSTKKIHKKYPQVDLYLYIYFLKGTHWWHSHNSLQRGDGLVGPLIVRQPKQDNVHSDLYDIGKLALFKFV